MSNEAMPIAVAASVMFDDGTFHCPYTWNTFCGLLNYEDELKSELPLALNVALHAENRAKGWLCNTAWYCCDRC